MKFSTQIKPISYLKANAAEVVRTLAEQRKPLVITQNGEAKAVTQDVVSYEETQETIALLKLLALGNRQIEEGRVVPAKAAFNAFARRRQTADAIRGVVDRGCGAGPRGNSRLHQRARRSPAKAAHALERPETAIEGPPQTQSAALTRRNSWFYLRDDPAQGRLAAKILAAGDIFVPKTVVLELE